jgi:hypothetical protein
MVNRSVLASLEAYQRCVIRHLAVVRRVTPSANLAIKLLHLKLPVCKNSSYNRMGVKSTYGVEGET